MTTPSETPINYALTDLMGVTEVADALGVGIPWTGADLADVMELVLAGYDEMRAQMAEIERAAERERLAEFADQAAADGVVEAIQTMNAQGARIADVMAEWGMTYDEWVFVFSWSPHETARIRWERLAPTNTLLEFEAAVYDGATPKQLCSRFNMHADTYRGLIVRLGLGGRVKSQRWTPAEKATFKTWVDEGCDTAELASRTWRQFGRKINRDRASKIRAELNGVKPVRNRSTEKAAAA